MGSQNFSKMPKFKTDEENNITKIKYIFYKCDH